MVYGMAIAYLLFYRTFINLLSDSSGDEDICESEVKVAGIAETGLEGYVCMSPEIFNKNTPNHM